jgi:Flp pilus assembly protein TadD
MKKTVTLFIFAVMLTISAFAQSIQEGVSHLYAERTTSAQNIFDKLIAANPNNLEAVYWLGQTHLINQDVPGARAVYERALAANGNAPLILVGMGHVELIEEKKSEARQRFETAAVHEENSNIILFCSYANHICICTINSGRCKSFIC